MPKVKVSRMAAISLESSWNYSNVKLCCSTICLRSTLVYIRVELEVAPSRRMKSISLMSKLVETFLEPIIPTLGLFRIHAARIPYFLILSQKASASNENQLKMLCTKHAFKVSFLKTLA